MNNKNKKIGIFPCIIGTLAVIVGVLIYILISSLINRLFVGARFGNGVACALLNLSSIGITVAFVLYELIFLVWLVKKYKWSDRAESNKKLNKLFLLVFVVCICLSLLFAAVSANTLTELREDAINKVFFVTGREYRWDTRCDILRYSLICSPEGALEFKIIMKDGETVELFNSVNSCTEEFIAEYENLYGYAAYLDKQFSESEFIIESKIDGVEYMEKYYKDAYPEIWKYLEMIINNNN